MNTKDIAAEYRLSHWAQVVQDRVEKGISIRLYCKEVGIHENTYFYWQRKLREAACTGLQTGSMPGAKSLVPKGWAALSVKEEGNSVHGLTVEVGGCRIHVQADTDTGLLARVCRTLKAL